MTEFWSKEDPREKWFGSPLSEFLNTTAESLIVKHRLRNTHGEVVCWNCLGRVAIMPHLHCRDCYADWKRRNGSE